MSETKEPPQTERREGVLEDSEATLRQVAVALKDFGGAAEAPPVTDTDSPVRSLLDHLEGQPKGLGDLIEVLFRTHGQIMAVIDGLRHSRGLLEQHAMDRLHTTHEKLQEVSSATEVAATGMLDGLDRSLVLVDRLESDSQLEGDSDTPETSPELHDELRDELHQLITLLQFQDITAQQLGYASTVLADIEDRLIELADFFDVGMLNKGGEDADERPNEDEVLETCDPNASTLDSDGRQALADEIFT